MHLLPLCPDRQPLSEKCMVGFVIFVIFFAQGLLLSECCKETAIFYFVVQISTPFGKDRVIKKCKPSSSLAFVSFSREFLRPLFLFLKVIQIVTNNNNNTTRLKRLQSSKAALKTFATFTFYLL